jgi:acyl-CoA thioesterase YciA
VGDALRVRYSDTMPENTNLALQVVMMPRDANPLPTALPGSAPCLLYATIFGGVILSYIDQAGAIGARREVIRAGGPPPFLVTVALNRVEFHQPVLVGDVVRFLTRLVRLGRTSVTVHVSVEAERGQQVLQVTEAEVVYVGIDATSPERRPKPLLAGDT